MSKRIGIAVAVVVGAYLLGVHEVVIPVLLLPTMSEGVCAYRVTAHLGRGPTFIAMILVCMALISIGVFVERAWSYRTAACQARDFGPALRQALWRRNMREASELARRYPTSYLASILDAVLPLSAANVPHSELRHAMRAAREARLTDLRRGLATLGTIASTAPLVGLLGTLVGISSALQGARSAESTGVGAIAGGLSESLIPAILGMTVAVSASWMFSALAQRLDGFAVDARATMTEISIAIASASERTPNAARAGSRDRHARYLGRSATEESPTFSAASR